MSTFPSTNAQSGFSLIELVIVLAIIGSLTIIALPRFSPSDNTLPAQADRLARDLRHTQALAMNQGRTLNFEIQSTSIYRVTFGGNTITDPATMQPYSVNLDNNVTLSGTDTGIDSLGRPISSGSLLAVARIFTLVGDSRSSNVTLNPVTGFVTVNP